MALVKIKMSFFYGSHQDSASKENLDVYEKILLSREYDSPRSLEGKTIKCKERIFNTSLIYSFNYSIIVHTWWTFSHRLAYSIIDTDIYHGTCIINA